MYATREAFELYCYYLAVKRHFTSDYDFFKYNGKTNIKAESFEKRNDKRYFHKLTRVFDPKGRILANLIANPNCWIGDIQDEPGEKIYLAWAKRKEALTHTVREEMSSLNEDFNSNLIVTDGQYPRLLQLYMMKKVSLETLVIIDDLVGACAYWDSRITDPVIYPSVRILIKKVRPFMDYDKAKMKKLILASFT